MPRSRPGARLAAAVVGLVAAAGLVTVAPATPAGAVDAPGSLTATEARNPVLAWSRVAGATGYDVELSRSSDFTVESRIGSVVSTANVRYVPPTQLPSDLVWWRVRAKTGSTPGDWTVGSFTPLATDAPVLVRPQPDTRFRAPEAPYFTWEPVAGATAYVVQTSRDPLFTDPAGVSESRQRTTAAYLTSYPPVGTYYWRVRAELSSGYWSAWSDSRPYGVEGLPAVQLVGPADTFDESVRDVVLDWEPVPGAASYEVEVNTDDGFAGATMKADVSVVGTSWSPGSTLNNDEYYWRVRAVDASGNAAAWPETPWRLRRAWPDQPDLVHPRGAVGAAPFFYEWTAIERASRYQVQVTGPDDYTCSFGTVHTTLAGECVPDEAGQYSWKVLAYDGTSNVITDLIAQPAATFTYTPPAPIVPAAPGTLSTGQVSGHATSVTGTASLPGPGRDVCTAVIPATCVDLRQTPVLTWDPVPGATSYRLTLANDRELTNKVGGFDGVRVEQPMFTFTRTLPDSQAGSAYFWVVQPCSSTCAPPAYPTSSFAKKTVAPTLVAPAADALVSDDVTLDWNPYLDALRAPRAATDTSALGTPAGTEAQTYTVQTSTDPSFVSGSVLEQVTVDEHVHTSPSSTYPEGYVYWRVRANDGSGNPSIWSETRRFEKRSPKPTLATPVAGGELAADYTLSWQPLLFAKAYDLEVYQGPTRVANPSGIKYSSWAPSDPFPVATGEYTWRVRRVDAKDRRGEWTDFRTFRMAGFPLTAAGPAEGALVPPTGALFSWLPDPRATSYRFERRKPDDATGALAETVSTRAAAWAPTSALAAGTAQWRVVALDAAGKDLGASPWRTFVVVDPPATTTAVSISGSGKIGTDLRVSAPTFDPPAETTTYQWYRGSSTISGATGETYTLTSADLGKVITVRAAGTLTGYRSATSTSNAVTGVTGEALVAAYPPAIDGDPRVGSTVTVVPGVWADEPRLSYQWFRDGAPISRATSSTYRLTGDDAGHEVHVVETAKATGRTDGTAPSEPVTVATAGSLSATTLPTVSGTPAVGQRLSATSGTWNTGATYRYQWLREGVVVPGAASSSYTVTAADAGRRLQVRVTAVASGWDPGTATSAARLVARAPSTTAVRLAAARIRARQRPVVTVTVSAPGLSRPGGTVTVLDGSRRLVVRALGTASSVRLTLPRLRPGNHAIKAVYSGGSQVAGSSRAVRLVVTR